MKKKLKLCVLSREMYPFVVGGSEIQATELSQWISQSKDSTALILTQSKMGGFLKNLKVLRVPHFSTNGLRTVSFFLVFLKLRQIRKEQYQENLKTEPPFAIGDMSKLGEVISDEAILLRVVAGVPVVKPELKADIYGSNSTPGVAECTARVIMSHEEFHLVQPGEIVVTVSTSPIWTPLFAIVNGVVTDTGGGLTHAIIVGREFGLPVVAGTMEGTRKIKTGDRIRVDGDNCCVYILG